MKKIIITSVLLIAAGMLSAQSIKETQYAAYLTASKTMWERSLKMSSKAHGERSLEAAMAMYGILNNTMANQDEETFDQYKDLTIEILKEIIEVNPERGEPKAVLSSVYGLVMAYSPMKGMFLGPKSTSLMSEAMKQQPESPLVQKLYAGSKLYTPTMFGGDPEEAVKSFTKAIEIYDEIGNTDSDWLYLDSMMGLAMSYQKTNNSDAAKSTLEKAIAIEPNYHWAKATLGKLSKS